MKGIHKIRVSNRYADFRFVLRRNITVVRGDSGTGKTTLFNMVAEFARLGASSGINLSSDKKCIALTDSDWRHQLENTADSIVFADEGDRYIYSHDFAEAIRRTDNYYVLFIRENLHELPYSVEEIYEIKTSGKYHTLKNMYKVQKGYIYGRNANGRKNFQTLLTEDSRSGFQFFESYYENSSVDCASSNSNSGIYGWIEEHRDRKIFVVADGAAFGSEMNRVMALQQRFPDITICLPESFEWLILKSGLIPDENLKDILENTSDYVDSDRYFSWEQYFHRYLVEQTNNTYMKYSKDRIGEFYTIENNAKKIAAVILL